MSAGPISVSSRPGPRPTTSLQGKSAEKFYGAKGTRANRAHGNRQTVFEELREESMFSGEDSSDTDEEDYSLREKKSVLDFLNGCGQEELCDIPGCTITKAKMLTPLLPFKNWETLVCPTFS